MFSFDAEEGVETPDFEVFWKNAGVGVGQHHEIFLLRFNFAFICSHVLLHLQNLEIFL